MQVIVDKHTVTIVKNEIVNEGEYNVQSCNFQFSSDYDGLPKIAIFKTNAVTKQIMLSGNTCITPEEVLQTTGIVGLGVYAYQTDGDNLTLRYSPTPAVFTVEPGSYDEGDAPTPPTPSVIEQLQEEITQNANNITSLENVTSTHTTQIGTLQTDVNNIKTEQITQNTNIQTNANDISNIKTEQITQNNNIQANTDDITTLQTSLSNETTNRENADINLQQQIDAITSSSDIVDIVGTYAQLQAYDTQHLSNNDVIKVLQDETHENAMTYYRWDKHNSQWIYIGQEAPYYTKSETDTLLQGKANANDVYTKSQIDDTLEDYVETTTYTQGQATQNANIEENASNIDWLQTLVNQMPTVSGQGTDLSLESVLNYRLMKFLPQGNASQFSTTGKNLLNSITDTTTRNGITFTKNSDGTYTLNGTSTSDIDFNIASDVPLDLNTSYILSGSPNTASNTTYRIMGACTRDNDSTTYIADNDGSGVTIPSSKKIRVYINVKNGKTLNNVIFKPMIRLATITDSTYESYTGGIPAPNPSYQIMPSRVTGENGLVIRNENILNNLNYSLGNIDANGQDYPSGNTYRFNEYMPVNEQTTIYLLKRLVAVYYDENKEYISQTSSGFLTLTTPAGTKYARFRTFAGDFSTFNNTDYMVSLNPITSYIPYQVQTYPISLGNIELCSTPDGTIRDYIYGTPDNWKKKQFMQKIILNGSESYGKNASGTGFISFTLSNYITSIDKDVSSYLFSNMLQSKASGNVANTCRIASSGRIVLTFSDTFCNYDLTALSTTLQTMYNNNNPVILYIPLATATDINITDTTLIGQLNSIYNNAHSYNGVTNITTTYEDGNEQMYLDIEALKNVWEVTQ